MALGYRSGILTGLGLSVAAAFIIPRWGRPMSKAAIKGGMAAYESASEQLARLREALEDITAEVAFERKAEYEAASQAERAAAASQGVQAAATGQEKAAEPGLAPVS